MRARMLAIHANIVSVCKVKRVLSFEGRVYSRQEVSQGGKLKFEGVPVHLFMLALSYTSTSCCFAFVAVNLHQTATSVWTRGFYTSTIFLIQSCTTGDLLFSSPRLGEAHKYFLSGLDPEWIRSTARVLIRVRWWILVFSLSLHLFTLFLQQPAE